VIETEILTEEEYDKRFEPVAVYADDNSIWEYRQISGEPTEHVWSVVEVEGDLYAIPGWHVVDVIGYNLTAHPWPHENIEVKFWNPHDDHEGDCSEGCVV
jgi:hypothetical protein